MAPEPLELREELPPEGRLLRAEDRELPPDGRLLRTDEREPPLEEPLLLTDGLDLLPEDLELPTEPDRGTVYRPGLLPTELRDREVEPLRLDDPGDKVVGRLYRDELDPGTTTGLELPTAPAPVRGLTSGRDDPPAEPMPSAADDVPPPAPYKVGR